VGCVACKEDKPTLGGTEEKPAPRSPTPSTDCAASIDDASKALRRALQYKATSDQPAKLCSACVQFIANKYGTCGGGCKLITGPVLPGGSCLSYAPVTSDAASPVKAL